MELKGLTRFGRVAAVTAASVVSLLGVAPVASAQEAATWEMPALRGEVLQNAIDAVTSAAGEGNVKFNLVDSTFNQVVYNYTNWLVCGQSPRAESTVKLNPQKPQSVTLALKRPSTGC
ncbi:hypothetical protein FHR72_002747 [Mycolicibacterium iranicum]|uniref:PASTA domain-containing protein n=1 Tax=Mycolicibacterium iranicum TaxID=912594 RepID=A0A839Q6Y9_MYCIR|nr:hypothetical protein [Mycolicibacterium iranicum]MBB2991263.1 hypothetical protein [Mycolicibacterium iranicum]